MTPNKKDLRSFKNFVSLKLNWRFKKLNYASSSEEEVHEDELVEVGKPGVQKVEKKQISVTYYS